MFNRIDGMPVQIFGIEASGKVLSDEVDEVAIAFADFTRTGQTVDVLFDLHRGTVFSIEAAKDRFENRLLFRGKVRRAALIGGGLEREAFLEFLKFVRCESRTFSYGDRTAALEWLGSK
jgi:hypothetical protein